MASKGLLQILYGLPVGDLLGWGTVGDAVEHFGNRNFGKKAVGVPYLPQLGYQIKFVLG